MVNTIKILIGQIVLLIVFSLTTVDSYSQTIVGPTNVSVGQTVSYSFTDNTTYAGPSWTVTNGTVTSWAEGTEYFASVTWTSVGTATLTFKQKAFTVASLTITVGAACTNPSAPTGTGNSRCGSGAVVLTASPGSNGNTVRWYSSATYGSLLATSTSYTTPSISATTTYYITTYNSTTNCESTAARVPVTATINTIIPGTPTGTGSSRCGTGTVTLSASPGTNSNAVRWYSSSTGGTLLATGSTYTTPTIDATTNYYISSYNTTSGCESGRVAVTATINIIPFIPGGANVSRCGPGTVTLTAVPDESGNKVYWYTASTGGTLLTTNASYTTPSLSSTTTYYISTYNTVTGCEGTTRAPISAIINPTPSNPIGTSAERCGVGTVVLSATPGANANTVRWYSASTGGTLLTTGTSYTTPSLSSTATYYIASYNSTAGCEGARIPITATVKPLPAAPTGANVTRCGTGIVTLSATPGANGNTVLWYSASSGGTPLTTGTTYTTPSLTSTTTYYISSYNTTTSCESTVPRIPISAIISTTLPSAPTGTGASACSGSVELYANPGSGGSTVRWYSASTGGTLLFTGSFFNTPSLTSPTTYYITTYNSTTTCESSPRVPVVAVVSSPAAPIGTNASRCGAGTVTLTATPVNGQWVNWYTSASGGHSIFSGNSFTTPSLSTTTTYYISSVDDGVCPESERVPVTATINPLPLPPTAINGARCGEGTVTLGGTVGQNGDLLQWYANSSGGSPLTSGATFTTPQIGVTTLYYISSLVTATGCESARSVVTATVNSNVVQPGTIGSNRTICTNTSPGMLTNETSATAGSGSISYQWQTSNNGTDWSNVTTNGISATYTPGNLSVKTYFRRMASTACASSATTPVVVTVDAETNAGSLGPINTEFSLDANTPSATGTLSLTGLVGSVQKWQMKEDGGAWTDIANTQNTYSYSGIKKTTYFRAEVKNGVCATLTSNEASVTILHSGKALYNGIIGSMRWRTNKAHGVTGNDLSGMYVFDYDEKYQIIDAQWAEPDHTLNTFSPAGNKFKITNLAYDPNGNIQTMHRYQENGTLKDNFTYTYQANKNKLTNVSGYVNQYSYNAIGQMTGEDKATGGDQYVEYDVTGKVVKVFSDAAHTTTKVAYEYDDRGFRLAKKVYDSQGAITLTTWYIRDAGGTIISVYEEQPDHEIAETEVPIYGSGKLGTMYPQHNGSTAYEITDHLGNVRALVRDNSMVYTATMEDNNQVDITNPRVQEIAYFENLFETAVDDPNMNHTPDDATIVSDPSMAAHLYWIGGTPGMDAIDKSMGPAIALKVNPGDTIKAEAYVRYREETTYTRSGFTLGLLSSLLGNSFALSGGFEGSTMTQITESFNNAVTSGGFLNDGTDNTRPYAYLNYIVMDENYNRVSSGWKRVTDAGSFEAGQEFIPPGQSPENWVGFEHLQLDNPVIIGPTGKYVYVWVSNESQGAHVWFDDVSITHIGSYVAQATDYGVWGDVITEQRSELEDKYRFGYQGQFAEKDEETGWNHFELREYDPILGRWLVPDPKRQYPSRYLAFGNNPVKRIDPDGGSDGEEGTPGFFGRFVNAVKNMFNDFFAIPSSQPEFNDSIDPENVEQVKTVEKAVARVSRKMEAVNTIAQNQVSPYVTISLGKQSPELGYLSLNGSLTLTRYGLYYSYGADVTFSPSGYPSASVSGGFMWGRNLRSQIPGVGVGLSAGSFVGIEYQRSVSSSGFAPGGQLGLVLSTSPTWFSGVIQRTEPLYTNPDPLMGTGGWFSE